MSFIEYDSDPDRCHSPRPNEPNKATCFRWYHWGCDQGSDCEFEHARALNWPIAVPPGYSHTATCTRKFCPLRTDLVGLQDRWRVEDFDRKQHRRERLALGGNPNDDENLFFRDPASEDESEAMDISSDSEPEAHPIGAGERTRTPPWRNRSYNEICFYYYHGGRCIYVEDCPFYHENDDRFPVNLPEVDLSRWHLTCQFPRCPYRTGTRPGTQGTLATNSQFSSNNSHYELSSDTEQRARQQTTSRGNLTEHDLFPTYTRRVDSYRPLRLGYDSYTPAHRRTMRSRRREHEDDIEEDMDEATVRRERARMAERRRGRQAADQSADDDDDVEVSQPHNTQQAPTHHRSKRVIQWINPHGEYEHCKFASASSSPELEKRPADQDMEEEEEKEEGSLGGDNQDTTARSLDDQKPSYSPSGSWKEGSKFNGFAWEDA